MTKKAVPSDAEGSKHTEARDEGLRDGAQEDYGKSEGPRGDARREASAVRVPPLHVGHYPAVDESRTRPGHEAVGHVDEPGGAPSQEGGGQDTRRKDEGSRRYHRPRADPVEQKAAAQGSRHEGEQHEGRGQGDLPEIPAEMPDDMGLKDAPHVEDADAEL